MDDNTLLQEIHVELTPPPDLQVTSLVSKLEAFSGTDIPVEWTVTNKGQGDTRVAQWKDIVYLSADSILNVTSAVKLAEVLHGKGLLKKDSSYTVIDTVSLPLKTFGMQYLYIVTDATNQVLEFSLENNNTKQSEPLTIFLTPPPDFIVSQVDAPVIATTGETVPITWFVRNQGASPPHKSVNTWTDAVYLSQDSVFNSQTATLLDLANPPLAQYNIPAMNPGEFYNNTAQVTMPEKTKGTWYFYVITDFYNNVFEYQRENNNIFRSVIDIVNSDLVVSNVQVPDSAGSGASIKLQWLVKNIGRGKLIDKPRFDAVWLSLTAQYDAGTAIKLGEFSYNNTLDTASTLPREGQVKLPDTLSGRFYVIVQADSWNYLYEENENNNFSMAMPVLISLAAFPDLQVTSASAAKDTIVAGNKLAIHYKVANNGTGPVIGKSWYDQVFVSKEPVWNAAKATRVEQVSRSQALMPGDFYETTDSVDINLKLLHDLGIDGLNRYFYILTDATNQVFEFKNENNNVLRTGAVYLRQGPLPDLMVTAVAALDSAFSGKPASVEWSVKNTGAATGYFTGYWYDGLYLSKDTLFDKTDIAVFSKLIPGPVAQNGSYDERMTFTIPNGLSGDYYLIMVSDLENSNIDKDRSNNVKVVGITVNQPGQPPVTMPTPVHVTLTPSSDLVVSNLQVPQIGYAGQKVRIKWRVANIGVAATMTGGWNESVSLSLNEKEDGSTQLLASYNRKGNLAAGAFYEDSMDITLPIQSLGNYYILFKTDARNAIYEHNAEDNNTASALIFVIQTPPADLVVDSVIAPAQAMIGDTVSVRWIIRNVGDNPLINQLSDGIYSSRDSVWDKDDILLGTLNEAVSLAPLGQITRTAMVKVTAPMTGRNFILVRTDLTNLYAEPNEDNNVSSSGAMQLDVRTLPLDVATSNELHNNDALYYKIDIPDSLAGQTLLVSLSADSAQGTSNELYLKYGSLPTRTVYDFAFSKAFSASQDVVVPALQKGTYYLLVYGSARIETQRISLLAKKINFEIHTVASNIGGNTGLVTVKIMGARFEQDMRVSLSNTALGAITASSVNFRGSTTIFATFNLQGAAIGQYDLRLVRQDNQEAVLQGSFVIVAGTGGSVTGNGDAAGFTCTVQNAGVDELVDIYVDHPASARILRIFPMIIKYGNSGNVDIPVPTKILTCLNGTPISFTTDDILKAYKEMDKTKRWDELLIDFVDPDGVSGILRPGASGSIIIYGGAFTPHETLTFQLR